MARGKPITIDDHLHGAKAGVAVPATFIVQTINETGPTFQTSLTGLIGCARRSRGAGAGSLPLAAPSKAPKQSNGSSDWDYRVSVKSIRESREAIVASAPLSGRLFTRRAVQILRVCRISGQRDRPL
jgi:hypothetical protein